MSDRRQFLTGMGVGVFGVVRTGVPDVRVPVVDARETIYHGHPDGLTTLVRFTAHGIDAPAARLRVYATGRRLVGTAGLLRSGDRLYGELWLPLREPLTVESQLEAPGLRSMVRTTHRLAPTPRWTVVLLYAGDPDRLQQALAALPHVSRVAQTAIWRNAGVRGNPLRDVASLHGADHIPFLRAGDGARQLEQALGIPTSGIAVAPDVAALPPTTPLALRGVGVSLLADLGGSVAAPGWWRSADGSAVLVLPVARDRDAASLGLTTSIGDAVAQVELWLQHAALDASRGIVTAESDGEYVVLLAAGDPANATARAVSMTAGWNRRFAFPRILTEGEPAARQVFDGVRAAAFAAVQLPETSPLAVPTVAALTEISHRRSQEAATRARDMLHLLSAQLTRSQEADDPASVVARQIGTAFPGTLVVNPTPFRRSDTVTLPDGSCRMVTDVPPTGYAFVLDDGAGGITPVTRVTRSSAVTTATFRLEIDRKSGTIRSLRSRGDGREWARPAGLNDIRGAILEHLEVDELPGIGVRVTARRWSSDLHDFTSVITVYDALPWIDVENHLPTQLAEPPKCSFFPALDNPTVRWAVPGGSRHASPPVTHGAQLRWVTLTQGMQSVAFATLEAPFFSIRADGTLVSHLPPGRSRIRIRPANFPMFVEDGARFGWSIVPFTTIPVAANPAGRLPRFGSLFVLDQPDAAILGILSSAAPDGALLYVQNLSGTDRFLTLGHGLLRFDEARRVDLLDRNPGEALSSVPDGIALPSAPWGVTALRLTGLRIREG